MEYNNILIKLMSLVKEKKEKIQYWEIRFSHVNFTLNGSITDNLCSACNIKTKVLSDLNLSQLMIILQKPKLFDDHPQLMQSKLFPPLSLLFSHISAVNYHLISFCTHHHHYHYHHNHHHLSGIRQRQPVFQLQKHKSFCSITASCGSKQAVSLSACKITP